jgi:hypothetical protein
MRVARQPVMTAEPNGQVLELDVAQSPVTFEESLQLGSVEVCWLG